LQAVSHAHTPNSLGQTESHYIRGECDIEKEITSHHNPRFVLHDSKGFEPGESGNLNKVKSFLQARGEGVELKDRVHAVWCVVFCRITEYREKSESRLCIRVPFAGGRVFEKGDEEFLQLGLKGMLEL
jgi:hypothetical protein